MRRYSQRYLGNTKKKEVHDLEKEKTNCQIDEIVAAGNDKPFATLTAAHAAGYDNCKWCLGGSKR